MHQTVRFSVCHTYRYELWRRWNESLPYAMFIGLNPSTADETNDDPTIRRCRRFAKDWGYGDLCMVNLFGYCAKQLKNMKQEINPIGPDNNQTLIDIAANAEIIVGAWGNHGLFMNRSKEIKLLIKNVMCLKVNKSGEPTHPLYLGSYLKPIICLN